MSLGWLEGAKVDPNKKHDNPQDLLNSLCLHFSSCFETELDVGKAFKERSMAYSPLHTAEAHDQSWRKGNWVAEPPNSETAGGMFDFGIQG